MKLIKSCEINGKTWRFDWSVDADDKTYGLCQFDIHTIQVDPHQTPANLMDTIIHETIHASRPAMREDQVATLANDIARVLWKVGYRA